ncbi:UDP-N-acetylglucosamine 1-carboxyvinyltransferase [Candidatus Woesebacteria bacterium]|nr:UDP-N-acetylglucosamine 1-carboxyvinyltransferase [Candidatus Woesebacteria bacterium]
MEDTYIIEGGNPLCGKVELSGAKNIALKVLIAALLFDSTVVLNNIPRIADINELIHLLQVLGAGVTFEGNTVTIDPTTLRENKVDLLHASKIRASFLLFAPLLYRFEQAIIPNPGGCRLGARSIDRVIDGLKALGIDITYDSSTGYYNSEMKTRPHGEYTFPKPSHTGTELMIMMSVLGTGTIHLRNVALEPEIDDLITLLNEGGAQIAREGNDITITGVEKLHQEQPFTIASDRVEAITYAVAGIATRGDVTISHISDHFIQTFVDTITQAGAGVEKISDGTWRFFHKPLHAMNVETAPHPGFLTDWQPLMAILMTQAEGKSIIHERIFENRFSYVEELRKLGSHIQYVDYAVENPSEHYHFNYDSAKKYEQTIQITGPQTMHGGVMNVSDLRAGATLAIAALMAQGESYVRGIHHLERGYERFAEKITKLGGEIRKL